MHPPHNHQTTPWRHPSDLLNLRTSLYSPRSPADQAHAIATVAAWKLRGNVPHAVESTALLFDALLLHARLCQNASGSGSGSGSDADADADDSPPAQEAQSGGATALATIHAFTLRASYTTALSRFVTGYADLGRHRSGPGQSMFEVARSVALPVHFVELRHEVAHAEMPGLGRLVRAAREAVGWLWGVYWGRLGGAEGVSWGLDREEAREAVEEVPVERVRERAREVLKEFRGWRVGRLKVKSKGKAAKAEGQELERQVTKVTKLCQTYCYGGDEREKWEEVAGVLVDEALVVPSLKQRGPLGDDKLQGAYMLWDGLLQHMVETSPSFLESFLERAVAHNAAFTNTSDDTNSTDPAKWAMYRWIMHLLYSPEWEEVRRRTDDDWESVVLRECALYPNDQWSEDLAAEVLKEAEKDVADNWTNVVKAGATTDDDDDDAAASMASSRKSEVEPEVEMEEMPPSRRRGWRQERGDWKALPIGVVRS